MEFHGYQIEFYGESAADVVINYVLLNACLTLDESRFCKKKWKKFSQQYPEFGLQSQRSLHKLLEIITEQVDRAYEEIKQGDIEAAKKRLAKYNELGVGVYSSIDAKDPMKVVEAYQSYNRRAGAYDCQYVANSTIYLSIWIDW